MNSRETSSSVSRKSPGNIGLCNDQFHWNFGFHLLEPDGLFAQVFQPDLDRTFIAWISIDNPEFNSFFVQYGVTLAYIDIHPWIVA